MDKKTIELLTKAITDLNQAAKFNEEFTGQVHHMVLELYNQLGFKIPDDIANYEFRNKSPWSNEDV